MLAKIMKRNQAKLKLICVYQDENERLADTMNKPGVQDWLETIEDQKLTLLVKAHIKAQQELDDYMIKFKQEIWYMFPDDTF